MNENKGVIYILTNPCLIVNDMRPNKYDKKTFNFQEKYGIL